MLACVRDKDSTALTIEEMKDALKGIKQEANAAETPHEIKDFYKTGMAAHKNPSRQQLSSKVCFHMENTPILKHLSNVLILMG